MRVQAYQQFPITVTVTSVAPRPEGVPSSLFTAALVHEDWAASVAALLREYKQVGETSLQYPAARRVQTYFPVNAAGAPLYALRLVTPQGVTRDIDADFKIELMRLRYEFTLVWLPAAFTVADKLAEAMMRHLEHALDELFKANGLPPVWNPGDTGERDESAPLIDIIAETGPATLKSGVEIPQPV